jgi:FG-GAP-like repeat
MSRLSPCSAVQARRFRMYCACIAVVLTALPNVQASAATRVRPYTPLRGALQQIAKTEGVSLDQVLADPEHWLRVASLKQSKKGRLSPEIQPALPVDPSDPPIRFTFTRFLGALTDPMTGDFDGDGTQDVAAFNASSGVVAILDGDSAHPLTERYDLVLEAGDVLLAIADVDRDGRSDVIAHRSTDGTLAVYRSLGPASFAVPARLAVGALDRLVASDLTGDGWADLVGLTANGDVTTLINQQNGSFAVGAHATVPAPAAMPAVGDFDGDTRPDIAIKVQVDASTTRIRLLHNEGNQTLSLWTEIPEDVLPTFGNTAAADLDGDGHADIVDFQLDHLAYWRGHGDGTFDASAPIQIDSWANGAFLRMADFDRDGRMDLAVAVPTGYCYPGSCPRVAMFLGTDSGLATPPLQFMSDDPNLFGSVNPAGMAAGDFNGDDALDLAVVFLSSPTDARLVAMFNDGLGGFTTPVTIDLEDLSPMALGIGRNAKGEAPDLYVWDGTQTWLADLVGPHGCRTLGPFAQGQVVSTADLNADSIDDLMLAHGDSVDVLRATSTHAFAPVDTYAGGVFVACADFDGANGPDLIVADAGGAMSLRHNDGTGHFGPSMDTGWVLPPDVTSASGADLDGDGRAELLLGHNGDFTRDTLEVLWNGPIVFEASTKIAIGGLDAGGIYLTYPSTIAVGDLDGDGVPDIVVVDAAIGDNVGYVSTVHNGGARALGAETDYVAGKDPWEGAVVDLDRDGLDDVAVVCDQDQWNGAVKIFHSDPAGGLTEVSESTVGGMTAEHYPTTLALGDWDGDSKPDIVVGNRFSHSLTFYRNVSPHQIPSATLASLISAAAGPNAVHLEWYVSSAGFSATLERGETSDSWGPIGTVHADGTGHMTWIDSDVTPGSRVGYRLTWTESGATMHSPVTWLDVPSLARLSLAVEGARPNPSRGIPVLMLSLPEGGAATLEVYDVGGRRVIERRFEAASAGQHAIALRSERPLAPGMYLARVQQGGREATGRFAIIP